MEPGNVYLVRGAWFQPALLSAERSDRSTSCSGWTCTCFNPRSSPRRGATLRLARGAFSPSEFQPALLSAERSDYESLRLRRQIRAGFNPRSSPRRGATALGNSRDIRSGTVSTRAPLRGEERRKGNRSPARVPRFNPRSSPRRGATRPIPPTAIRRCFNPRSSPRRGATSPPNALMLAMKVSTRAPLRGEERPPPRPRPSSARRFNPRSSPRRGATGRRVGSRVGRTVSTRAPLRGEERQHPTGRVQPVLPVSTRAPLRGEERLPGYGAIGRYFKFQPALLSAERSDVRMPRLPLDVQGFNPRSSPRRGATSGEAPPAGDGRLRVSTRAPLRGEERPDLPRRLRHRRVSTRAPLRGEERRGAGGRLRRDAFQPALLSAERSDGFRAHPRLLRVSTRAPLRGEERRPPPAPSSRSCQVSTRAPLRGEERPARPHRVRGQTRCFNPRSSPRRGATPPGERDPRCSKFQPALLSAERSDSPGSPRRWL